MLRKITFIIIVYTLSLLAEDLPPTCKDELFIPYSRDMLLNGINGSVFVDLYLDSDGVIDSLSFENSPGRYIDSLIVQKLQMSKFSPAKENGKNVASQFTLEFSFPVEDAYANQDQFKSLSLFLIDSTNGLPIEGAEVECRLKFSDLENKINISFDKYLDLLSAFSGQFKKENRIAARSNIDGNVNFYGFCNGTLDVLIHHSKYKNIVLKNITIGDSCKIIKMNLLKKDNNAVNSDLEMIVLEYRDDFNEYIEASEVVEKVGLTDDLNEIVSKEPAVITMPKRNSLLLVNSTGLFDAKYLINDIPVFSPTHFSGYASVSKGGLVLSDLTKVKLVTGRLGGRYSDVQGAVIDVSTIDNGIWSYTKRFNAFFDLSYEKFTLSFMLQDKPKNNRIQLTYSMGHKGLFRNYSGAGTHLKSFNEYGYSSPKNFYDLQLKAYNKIRKGGIDTFLWLGVDQFNKSSYLDERDIPIGFGAVVYRTSDKENCLKLTIGGSSQYYDEGKRIGVVSPLKMMEKENLSFILEKNEIDFLKMKIDQKFQLERVIAEGTIGYRAAYQYFKLEDYKQDEMILTDKFGVKYEGEKGAIGIDLLFGTKFSKASSFIDPGFWTLLPFFIGDLTFSLGVVSSYPDIRGFPDKSYSEKVYKTINVSTKLSLPFNRFVSTTIEPFMRYSGDYPKIGKDPIYHVWNESLKSPVYARGVNFGLDLEFPKFLSITLTGAFNKADRYNNGKTEPYEWEVPWQIKGAFHLFFFNKLINIYIKPTFFSGIPYYDYANNASIEVSDPYSSTDMVLEFQVQEFNDTPIQKLKAFIGLENFSVNRDGSEVYWSEDMVPLSYNLTPLQLTFGARAMIGSKR